MNEQTLRDTIAACPLPANVELESVRFYTDGPHQRYAVRFLRRWPGSLRSASVAAVLLLDPATDDAETLRSLLREYLPA